MTHARFVVASKKADVTEIPDTQADVDDGSSDSNEDSQEEDFEVTSKNTPSAPKPRSSSSHSSKLPAGNFNGKPPKKATTTTGRQHVNTHAAASDGDEGDHDEDDVSTRSTTSRDSTTTTKGAKGKHAGGGKSKHRSKPPTSVPQLKVAAKPVSRAQIPVGIAAAEGAADDLVLDDPQPSEVLLYMSSLLLSCGDRV